MAQHDEGVKTSLRLVKDVDPEQVTSPEDCDVRSDEPATEEPWFSEAVAILKEPQVKEYLGATTIMPMGMKTEKVDLFEGPSKCHCCINWVMEEPDDTKENLEGTDEVKQHAVLVRKKKSHQKYSHEPLEIDSIVVNSPIIRTALERIFRDYPAIDVETEDWTFEAPFQPFFHYWDDIQELTESEDSEISSHLKVLDKVLSPVFEEPLRLSKNLISHGLISFELLWTLFRSGQSIYCSASHEGDTEFLLILESSRYKRGGPGEESSYSLAGTMVDWDGKSFGLQKMGSKIKQFEGSKRITELSVYPLEAAKDIKTIKSRLEERGRQFERYAGIKYVAYSGIANRLRKFQNIVDYEVETLLDERIMIDASSYYREASNKLYLYPLDYASKRQLPKHRFHDESVDEHCYEDNELPQGDILGGGLPHAQHIYCSPWVKGYALKSKKWVSVLVAGVTDISWNDDVFDNLVLDQGYKRLIRGFVRSRIHKREAFDDFIDGKGRGIVMLLAGPPGVGKTLTAEATAEDLRAPLYSLSAGQLGLDANSVEERLHEVLQLCETWGAVLLLDEADVFLEQRTVHDLERNRLVSVFLRTLEYFEGVLFLTTNRLSDFDTAFESRIDFTLDFPALDYHGRLRIWKNLFAKVKLPVNLQDADYDELARVELNGRRIKNIIKSATVIAGNEDGSAVQRAHVDTILKVFAPKS